MSFKSYKENRPWGSFEQFTKNENSTVKILVVNAGEELSLQRHKMREEYWRVLSGNGEVVIGEKTIKAEKGNDFFVSKGTLHSIKAEEKMTILEIAFGDFDENDIERIFDKYNRV